MVRGLRENHVNKKGMGFVNNAETTGRETASEQNMEGKQNGYDKSFSELVQDSRRQRLPEIQASAFPMTMTEILRNPSKSESSDTNLPKIPLGQVHLVKGSAKSDEKGKKEKRRKRERKGKTHARRLPSPIPSNSISPSPSPEKEVNEYTPTWKKRLHKRTNKRMISTDGADHLDKLSVSRDFRLPALHEVRNVDLS